MHITGHCSGHNRCSPVLVWAYTISLLASNYLLVQAFPQQEQLQKREQQVTAAPPPQQQQQQQEQLQAKTNYNQEPNVALNTPNQTADLSLLINETLAINNKTLTSSEKTSLKDDWTFDMIEYDLMEFLQDLSARYKQSNKTGYSDDESGSSSDYSQHTGLLEAKKEPTDTIAKTSAPNTTSVLLQQPVDKAPSADKVQPVPVTATTHGAKFHPTSFPQLSTSLASGDSEIAESSWQYGIFDRFTRPKSTSKPSTTPTDVTYESDSGPRLDVRNFNSDECGLRTYNEDALFSPEGLDGLPSDEIPGPVNRLQISLGDARKKLHKPGSFLDMIKDRGDAIADNGASGDGIIQKQPSMMDQWEAGSLDEGKLHEAFDGHGAAPGGADGSGLADGDFNLASRRQWLQQQLGSTLQMLGFNTTNQSTSDLFMNQAGFGSNIRENMMKMSGKWGKSADFDRDNSGGGPQSGEPKLMARQDDLKLEARVIGGSDARLGDSPWSVSLQALVSRPGTGAVEYRHYCGGTIISEYYILTAAHCLDFMVGRESRLFVVVGDLNWRMSTTSLHGRRFGIEKLIIHSGYKSTAFGHDIGLIRTKESMKPLKVNGKYIINSVCLPQRGVEHSGEAELVGWGLFSNRNEMADSLQIADVPILPRPLCVDLYKRRTGLIQWLIGIELITEKQVCAGTFGRGICQGDSGSALVVNERYYPHQRRRLTASKGIRDRGEIRQSRATIIGIVAFGGIRRCSYQSLPGVYMQTSKYMDWILPRIQNTSHKL